MIRIILLTLSIVTTMGFSQTINRYGSTAANFLEIGAGSGTTAMEDGVTFAEGPTAAYWNPAAVAFIQRNETLL